MCEKHYYYNTTRDGAREKQTQLERCSQALRRGTPCDTPSKFRHPDGERPTNTSRFLSAGFPPSPPSSDTSFAHSGSDGERSHKRRSSVYINGEKVEIGRKPSRRERRGSNHVVIVEPPASPRSPRTPPRYETPVGSPSRSPTYTHQPRSRYYPSYTYPEGHLEINRPRRNSTIHYDYVSTKSKPRRDSYSLESSSIADEEARLRQIKRELRKAEEAKKDAERRAAEAQRKAAAQEDAVRQREKEARIKRQNEDIANRPAVPAAPAPLKYRRGSVSIKQPDYIDGMRNMHIDVEKEHRRREKRAQEQQQREDAALQERLRARMAPQPLQRSNTTGHGSNRRPTVLF